MANSLQNSVPVKSHQCFSGRVEFHEHDSDCTGTKMSYSVFLPDSVEFPQPRGCLIWLSGLTCTAENFMAKAGACRSLSQHGLMVVCPDTSPRGLHLPAEHDSWDFGSGASFYVDATADGYRDHYRMFSYITVELYSRIERFYDMAGRISISGHSMGGHGALVCALREPEKFVSVSAFAPIVNPLASPWGQKAFAGYLGGSDLETAKLYDTCELLRAGHRHPSKILIDQGTADEFLESQLLTERILKAAAPTKSSNGKLGALQSIELRMQKDYDHSYYFISTFIADHIDFHACQLAEKRK